MNFVIGRVANLVRIYFVILQSLSLPRKLAVVSQFFADYRK